MTFTEKTEVIYDGMTGVIDFVCKSYIVIQMPAASKNTSPPRLLVFPKYYKNVQVVDK